MAHLLSLIIIIGVVILAIVVKALRKAIGLLLVILGAIACLTFFGIIIGIPMIIIGGILLFA